jgi:hypothetical protein
LLLFLSPVRVIELWRRIPMGGLVFLYTTIAFGSALIYFAYH